MATVSPRLVGRRSFVSVVGLSLLVAGSVVAQNPPPKPQAPPQDYLVNVMPNNLGGTQRTAGTSGHSETFWVTNIGSLSDGAHGEIPCRRRLHEFDGD